MINIAHRIRLNPTPEQEEHFFAASGVARFTYNWALAQYNNALRRGEKPNINEIKREFNRQRREEGLAPFTYEVSSYANQYAFMDLKSAISRYFDLKKKDKLKPPKGWKGRKDGRPFGWPRFKGKRSKHAFGVANTAMKVVGHELTIARCPGTINMAERLRFSGKIMSGRVNYTDGHWYIGISVEEDVVLEPAPERVVGIDRGIIDLAVSSDGERWPNSKPLLRVSRKLARMQRKAAKQEKGSQNWKKTQRQINKLHATVRFRRQAYIHEITTYLAKNYNVLGLESLNIEGMQKNKHLARDIADAAMGELARQISYKAAWRESDVVFIDQWYPSSKRCSSCGHTLKSLDLSTRSWVCPQCGSINDRDINAAINIREEALRTLQAE